MTSTLTRNAVEATDDFGPEYLLADETIPSAEDIEAAFEEDEDEYPCCRCSGCFYCT